MRKHQFRVWFLNSEDGGAPVAVTVSAFGKNEALILAQAERINSGKDYKFITVEQVEEDSSYIIHTAKKYSFVKEPDGEVIIKYPGYPDRTTADTAVHALVEHVQKLEKMLCLIKESGR